MTRDDSATSDKRARANSMSRAAPLGTTGSGAHDSVVGGKRNDAMLQPPPLSASPPRLAVLPAPPEGDKPLKRALVIYAYRNAKLASTMSITKGEIISVERELTNEWWLGRAANGARGLFPAAYVRPVVASSKARALFDFVPSRDRHLAFVKGEIITVLRKDKAWWDGMANGRFGSFPGQL